MVAKQNLIVYQGSDFRRALELKNESAVLMDLTGYVFRGQAKSSYSSSAPAFSFVFTLRDQTSNKGVVDMVIPADSTSILSITKETEYLYDIEMVTADGVTSRIIEGKIKLYPEVTK